MFKDTGGEKHFTCKGTKLRINPISQKPCKQEECIKYFKVLREKTQ